MLNKLFGSKLFNLMDTKLSISLTLGKSIFSIFQIYAFYIIGIANNESSVAHIFGYSSLLLILYLIQPSIQQTFIKYIRLNYKHYICNFSKLTLFFSALLIIIIYIFSLTLNSNIAFGFSYIEKDIINNYIKAMIFITPLYAMSFLLEAESLTMKRYNYLAKSLIIRGLVSLFLFISLYIITNLSIFYLIIIALTLGEFSKIIFLLLSLQFISRRISIFKSKLIFPSQSLYIYFSTCINLISIFIIRDLLLKVSEDKNFELYVFTEQLQVYLYTVLFSGLILKFNTEIVTKKLNSLYLIKKYLSPQIIMTIIFSLATMFFLFILGTLINYISQDSSQVLIVINLFILFAMLFPFRVINTILSRCIINNDNSNIITYTSFMSVLYFLLFNIYMHESLSIYGIVLMIFLAEFLIMSTYLILIKKK